MALSLTINILNADINYSINKEDIELAQEVGLLNQTDDFENMITKEEEYFEDLDQFIYELEDLSQNSHWFECEGIYTNNYVYKDVPVRVNIKKPNYLIKQFEYLFGEDQGRYIVEIEKENFNKIKEILNENSIHYDEVGIVVEKDIIIDDKSKISIEELNLSDKTWLTKFMN